MSVEKQVWGKTAAGESVDLYTLTNANGLRVKIMTYGATIVSVETPDRNGRLENITVSLDSLDDYLRGHPCLGSTIGRFANRIAKGKFSIGDQQYTLATNNGPNHLHGGLKGFDKVVWQAKPVDSSNCSGVEFTYRATDGEEGYPGNVVATVVYRLTNDNTLRMEYAATTDQTTVVNLTNHAYWNLRNGGATDILDQELTISANHYLPTDSGLIPTGEIKAVQDTALDFTTAKKIGTNIQQVGGYDHCFVLNGGGTATTPALAANAYDPVSGRRMEVYTTEPGIQLYTANGLDGHLQGGGKTFQKFAAFCLEAQHFPDSPNCPWFPTTLLRPGEQYRQLTVHKFSCD
jgi:aldose 1-epimerase